MTTFQRLLACLFAGAVVVPLGPAFTLGRGGEGSGAISGYSVSQVRYAPAAGDPRKVAAVSFAIEPAGAGTVRVRLGGYDGWHACSVAAGRAECPLGPTEPELADVTALDVIAF